MLSFIKDITGIGNDQALPNQKPGENQNEKNEKNETTEKNNDPEQTTLLNQGTYGDIKEIYNKNPEI